MISINKYGQTLDLSKVVEVNGKKTFSLDGLVVDKSLIIEVPKGTKFSTSLQEDDLKIEFKDADGKIFELILKNMANLLAQNDGTQLVEIVQADDNKVLASITDITSALEAAAAGPAGPAAGANTNSDSAANSGLNNDELNLQNSIYDNARITQNLQNTGPEAALINPNSEPIIGVITDQTVDEDNTLLIPFTAIDANNDPLTSTGTALNGTVTIVGNVITYVPNLNFNGNDTITLTVNDGRVSVVRTIAVTVNPVNDVPTISADATTVIEDAAALLTTGGKINVVDVDVGESFVTPQTNIVGLYGTFSIDENGVWTYSADNTQSAIQSLGVTETLTETFAVVSKDGTATSNVVVTIQGTNDRPTILDVQINAVAEELGETIGTQVIHTGDLNVTDVDVNDTHTFAVSTPISYSILDQNGVVVNSLIDGLSVTILDAVTGTYKVEGDFDHLAAGETATITFGYIVTDSSGTVTATSDEKTVTLTVTGTNDQPVVSDVNVNSTITNNIGVINNLGGNNDIATALNIDGTFTTSINSDVVNSETTPYVSINGTGSNATDWYKFTVVNAGDSAIFDIDYGMNQGGSFDPWLNLYDVNGNRIAYNDDSSISNGDGGSIHNYDSYLTYTFSTPGTYYIEVARYSNTTINTGGTYTLQVSL
ncbi:DVUA0089 family protein, partial [bacterium]|nr:DVUA0089 family protein [bacterium]